MVSRTPGVAAGSSSRSRERGWREGERERADSKQSRCQTPASRHDPSSPSTEFFGLAVENAGRADLYEYPTRGKRCRSSHRTRTPVTTSFLISAHLSAVLVAGARIQETRAAERGVEPALALRTHSPSREERAAEAAGTIAALTLESRWLSRVPRRIPSRLSQSAACDARVGPRIPRLPRVCFHEAQNESPHLRGHRVLLGAVILVVIRGARRPALLAPCPFHLPEFPSASCEYECVASCYSGSASTTKRYCAEPRGVHAVRRRRS